MAKHWNLHHNDCIKFSKRPVRDCQHGKNWLGIVKFLMFGISYVLIHQDDALVLENCHYKYQLFSTRLEIFQISGNICEDNDIYISSIMPFL